MEKSLNESGISSKTPSPTKESTPTPLTIAQIAQKIEFPTEEAKKAFIERPYTPDDPLLIILPKTAEAWAQLLDMQQILRTFHTPQQPTYINDAVHIFQTHGQLHAVRVQLRQAFPDAFHFSVNQMGAYFGGDPANIPQGLAQYYNANFGATVFSWVSETDYLLVPDLDFFEF